MSVLGIDVSHHEGKIDWFAVANGGFRFAYAKATEGSTFIDPRFARNWERIREAGLLRGAYHFGRPGGDPEAQAAFFAATIGAPVRGDLPPVLDIEVSDGQKAAHIIEWTLRFVARAELLLERELMIYTGGLWRRTLDNPDVPELRTRLLWTARYGMREPVVPRTWKRWDFWQFTDGLSGRVVQVPGVNDACDVNRFRGELAELERLAEPSPVVALGWPGRTFVWPATPLVRGEDVKRWQTRMRERGYKLLVDGIYGPRSRRACVALQREVGLDPDGMVGRITWEKTFLP